jgi:hypothetical protein
MHFWQASISFWQSEAQSSALFVEQELSSHDFTQLLHAFKTASLLKMQSLQLLIKS